MSCFHPLNRIHFSNYGWKVCGNTLEKGEIAQLTNLYGAVLDQQKIACGQCIGCRMDYARDWATRCEIEMKQWQNNWFLTLTYDDEHLPKREGIDQDTGEILGIWDETVSPRKFHGISYLEPKDLTQFMKSLRTKWERNYGEDNIRFYACGEYGDEKQRAHFHIILFNCNIRDLKADHRNKKGNMIYTSDMISEVWGKGIVGITEANWETAAYTARYMLKKQKGKNAESYYKEHHQTPEFCRMSRMPGIASEWYNKNKDKLWETDEIILAKGRTVRTPKYYDKLFDQEIEKLDRYQDATNEEARFTKMTTLRNQIHEKRRAAAEATAQLKKQASSLTTQEQLNIEERALQEKINKKRRNVE